MSFWVASKEVPKFLSGTCFGFEGISGVPYKEPAPQAHLSSASEEKESLYDLRGSDSTFTTEVGNVGTKCCICISCFQQFLTFSLCRTDCITCPGSFGHVQVMLKSSQMLIPGFQCCPRRRPHPHPLPRGPSNPVLEPQAPVRN